MSEELELLKKMKDPKFYLESFCKIKTKEGGMENFKLNEAQKDLFNTLNTNNRVIILKCRQLGFCLHSDTKILTSDLRWKKIKDVQIGEKIVSVDEFPERGRGKGRKMREAIVKNKSTIIDKSYKIKFSNGEEIISTGKHKFLSKKWEECSETYWRKVEDMKVGTSVRYLTTTWDDASYEDGWIGGAIDGEGSIGKKNRTGAMVNISQIDGDVLKRIIKYFKKNKYHYGIQVDRRKKGNTSKLGDKEVIKVVISRMNELFKLIGKARPSRVIKRKWWEDKDLPGKRSGDAWVKVTSIEYVGRKKMIDLQTSKKTYIANGLVSHNSTAVTGYFYVQTIMNPGITSILVGYNTDMVEELFDKVKTFYRYTPKEIRPERKIDSKRQMSFPKLDSKIMALPNSINVGRGLTAQFCLVTELSSWDKDEEKMAGLEEAIPSSGTIVVESTPRGIANLYHRLWMTKDNGWNKKRYDWWWGYEKREMKEKKIKKGEMWFAQEYGCSFVSSGRSVFNHKIITKQRKNILKVGDKNDKHEVYEDEDKWIIYREPEEDGVYSLGADVAEGVEGGDFSAAIIWNKKTGEEVAFYRGLIAPDKFGEVLDKKGRKYNDAKLAVEVNNQGILVVNILKKLIYPNFYFRFTKPENLGQSITDKIGWRTTLANRDQLIGEYNQVVRDDDLIIHSEDLLNEMSTLIYDENNKIVSAGTFHDDTVFAAAISFQAFKNLYAGKLDQINYNKHLPGKYSY